MKFRGDDEVCVAKSPAAEFASPNVQLLNVASLTIGYPRMSASDESSTTMHRLLHASGSHPIPTPGDPK
ncbi:double-stranded RNA-binding protein 1-like [Dorcoceras hygrometricum]|uniref:Double-stranded RNA-binding protein 1-like n=1 Tax=Dorcoceras hygrometricum TaxID=472368 RepID=A0A2Z7CW15_9LAMI|nr:double-stranded RNA-binding protein 1-like [Dorcoceras hygrometricum]